MASKKSGSKGQVSDVRREAEKFKKAAGNLGQAVVELWSARIDVAIASGNEEEVRQLVKNPTSALVMTGTPTAPGDRAVESASPEQPGQTELYDSNGNCGCGGGAGGASW